MEVTVVFDALYTMRTLKMSRALSGWARLALHMRESWYKLGLSLSFCLCCQNAFCGVSGQLFSALVTHALQGLQQLSAFDHNPDTADDTFLLIHRGIRYSPSVVINSHMLPIIVDAAMTGVLVQHRCTLLLHTLRKAR